MRTCPCMPARTFIHVAAAERIRTYTHSRECLHVHTYYTCIRTSACKMYTRIHAYINRMRTYTVQQCTCIHSYIHTNVHTCRSIVGHVYYYRANAECLEVGRGLLIRESCSVWSQIILIGWIGVHVEYTKTMIEVSSLPVCILPAAIKRRTWPPLMYFRSLNSSKPPN